MILCIAFYLDLILHESGPGCSSLMGLLMELGGALTDMVKLVVMQFGFRTMRY